MNARTGTTAQSRNGGALEHLEHVIERDQGRSSVDYGAARPTTQAACSSNSLQRSLEAACGATHCPPGAIAIAAQAFADEYALDRLVVDVMSSNRFTPGTRGLVTSLNQWAPALLDGLGGGSDAAGRAGRAHRAVLAAYRHGVYDVDLLSDMCRRRGLAVASALSVNYIPGVVATPLDDSPPDVVDEEPLTAVYSQLCYVKLFDQGTSLRIRVVGRLPDTRSFTQRLVASSRADLAAAADRRSERAARA